MTADAGLGSACAERRLAAARIALGALVLLRTTPVLHPLGIGYLASTWPVLGWPSGSWRAPAPGLALPDACVAGLCIARTVAVVLFTLGVRARAAGLVAAGAGWLVMLQDELGFLQTLHLLWLGMALLALAGSGAAMALRPEAAASPLTGIWLVRAFVASVYAWAAIGKLRADWLDGRTLSLLYDIGGLHGPVGAIAASTTWRAPIAFSVVAVELALGPLLLWRRTRAAALAAAVGFHVLIETMARPDVLGLGMGALLLVFLEPRRSDGRREPRQGSHAAASMGQATSDCEHISSFVSGPGST